MPAGRTHDRITLWSLPVVAVAAVAIGRSSTVALAVTGAFLFSGLMFGPDLDVRSRQFARWGWLRWIWLPYQRALAHRSVLSHGPILGTVLRVLYLGGCLAAIAAAGLAIAQALGDSAPRWQSWVTRTGRWLAQHRVAVAASFVGLELGAMSHTLSDGAQSLRRRLRRSPRAARDKKRRPR
ncbi:MAG: metal-binding protein [Cyanobacteria bacterium QS_8_64_29]|nr:MAG: metal-binding protein [Cyanobacteria bacterium QS_8_64_29]